MRYSLLLVPHIDNALDVLLAQTVFVAVLHKSVLCINEEDTLTVDGVMFVQNKDASRYARTIEEVGRQADDALQVVTLHDVAAYGIFGVSTEEHAMGQDASSTSRVRFHAADEMEQESEVTTFGRR